MPCFNIQITQLTFQHCRVRSHVLGRSFASARMGHPLGLDARCDARHWLQERRIKTVHALDGYLVGSAFSAARLGNSVRRDVRLHA